MAEKKENNNIVINESKAYGYNYASLSDIAKQGFKIPKMKTGTEGDKDYVYYYDPDLKEWIRGAEIVVPEMKGSNSAQRYGSGITFARRYTCHLALQLACDDDKKVEAQAPSQSPSGLFDENVNLKSLAQEFLSLYTEEEKQKIFGNYKINRPEDLGIVNLQKYVNYKKYGPKQDAK